MERLYWIQEINYRELIPINYEEHVVVYEKLRYSLSGVGNKK